MTQQVAKARISLPTTDVNADNVSIDLYFEATGSNPNLDFSTASTPQQIAENFLIATAAGQTHALAYYLSPEISRSANACSISWTDITAHLDGSPAGPPFRIDTFTLPAAGSSLYFPYGVTSCIGYRRDYGTDVEHGSAGALPSDDRAIDQGAPATHTGIMRPRARDRGRIYLGPLNGAALDNGTAGCPYLPTFTGDLEAAFDGLAVTHNTISANQFNLVQWSRRGASIGVVKFYAMALYPSYQRRRVDERTTRVANWISV